MGSVGQSRDGNPKSCCATLEFTPGFRNLMIRLHRVAYDIPRAAERIISAGLPEEKPAATVGAIEIYGSGGVLDDVDLGSEEVAANEHGKIVTLHTKGAEREVLKLLERYDLSRVIVHWYAGPLDIFKELVDRREEFARIIRTSQRYILILIVIELALVVLELATGHGAKLLSIGRLFLPFFVYIVLGLLAPLGIAYYSDRVEYVGRYSMIVPASITSSILILIGGFFLRYVMLIAGQIIL